MLTGQQTLVNDACFVLECLEINVYGLWSVVLFKADSDSDPDDDYDDTRDGKQGFNPTVQNMF
jgi:hypothetical protein